MILKTKQQSSKMRYYLSLKGRRSMTERQKNDYFTLTAGDEGERQFFDIIQYYDEPVILWDVELTEKYRSTAQFDFLVIYQDTITHYDIKNLTGTYELQGSAFVNSYGNNIRNLNEQLDRAHDMLMRALSRGFHSYHVQSYIVFINEHFHFKGDTRNAKWLFRSQLAAHLKKYQDPNFSITGDMLLGNYLLKRHVKSQYDHPLKSEFTMEMAGLKCYKCGKMMRQGIEEGKKTIVCGCCGEKLSRQQLALHNLKELYVLKNAPFNMKEAVLWCKTLSERTISRVLLQHSKKEGKGKATKYYF